MPPLKEIMVRVSPQLYDAIRIAADERDVSMNFIIKQALEDFIPRLIPADEWKLTR